VSEILLIPVLSSHWHVLAFILSPYVSYLFLFAIDFTSLFHVVLLIIHVEIVRLNTCIFVNRNV
jgi:hypothetical protein